MRTAPYIDTDTPYQKLMRIGYQVHKEVFLPTQEKDYDPIPCAHTPQGRS